MPLAQRPTEARPGPDTEPDQHVVWKWAKGRCKPRAEAGMPGAGLTAEVLGKAQPDRLALKPYRGKPAVRNFRAMETAASCEARSAPSPYPTPLREPGQLEGLEGGLGVVNGADRTAGALTRQA